MCLYIPFDSNPHGEIENPKRQLPHPFILLGDLNAHSQEWGTDDLI